MGDHVLVSKRMTASGQVKNQNDDELTRSTVVGVYAVGGTGGGKITLRDGNGTAATVAVFDVLEDSALDLSVPMGGMLFRNKVYATLSGIESAIFFYR